MTENERKAMMILADTIKGEINRMCVTKELAEFDVMYGHAKRNLDRLSEMIYGARFVAEIEPQESDHKCHTCKHYTSGDHDGSCGSYICKGYSNWESEDKE